MASSSTLHAIGNTKQEPADSSSGGDMVQASALKVDVREPEMKAVGSPTGAPDGGFIAWLQCAGSFFLFFNGFGMVNSFGVFQSYYAQHGLPTEPASNIAWIGSLQACLLIGVGIFTGPLFDQGYLRTLIFSGTFALVFGMMMTSLCTQYWQFILAQGLVVGLGMGLHFVPSIALLPMYFSKKKALAQGIGASGSSLGGIIYPIIFHQLQPRIGFGWTVRLIAFIMLVTLSIPMIGMRMRVKPPAKRKLVDLAAWKELPYTTFGVAEFFGYMGVYVPFFYIQLFASEKTHGNESFAVYLLVLLNVGSFFGRIIPNHIADLIGPMNVLAPCCLITALLAFVWTDIKTQAGTIVFCIFYGFFSGSLVSIPPTVAVTLSPSLAVIGVRMGMLFVPIAAGLLVGNPIAGALLRSGWINLQVFCGAVVAFSGICVAAARCAKVGPRLNVKA